jgi:hypothetical protein
VKAESRAGADLVVLFSRVDRTLKAALERTARAAGQGEAELVRELLTEALAAREDHRPGKREREERVLARLEGLVARVNDIGTSTRAAVRLLAHWATQSGAVRVSEDELLAELRAVGKDEWQQAVEEMEGPHEGTAGDDAEAGKVLE